MCVSVCVYGHEKIKLVHIYTWEWSAFTGHNVFHATVLYAVATAGNQKKNKTKNIYLFTIIIISSPFFLFYPHDDSIILSIFFFFFVVYKWERGVPQHVGSSNFSFHPTTTFQPQGCTRPSLSNQVR